MKLHLVTRCFVMLRLTEAAGDWAAIGSTSVEGNCGSISIANVSDVGQLNQRNSVHTPISK
jgi:hypothetical protein